jgi:hypothetical protein
MKSGPIAQLAGLFLVLAVASAAAQPAPFNDRWQSAPAAKPVRPPAAAPKPQPPLPVSLEQALYLIRSTLLTLNDANRSGNYTVLRDLASPQFQAKNSAADLAVIFSDLRRRNFDLFAVAIAAPQLSAPPSRDKNLLRLTGLFPTRPLQINFDLLFEDVAGKWLLFGISVQTSEAPPLPQATRDARPAPAAAPKKP